MVAWGLLVIIAADFLDGHLARRWGVWTESLGRLDSRVDAFTVMNAGLWLLLLRPLAYTTLPPWPLVALTLHLVSVAVGWARFRQVGNLHLLSTKATGLTVAVFAAGAYAYGVWPPLLGLACGLAIFSAVEAILVFSLLPAHPGPVAHLAAALRQAGGRGRGSCR